MERKNPNIARSKDNDIGRNTHEFRNKSIFLFPGKGIFSKYFDDWKIKMLKRIESTFDRRHSYLDSAIDWERLSVDEDEEFPMVMGNSTQAKIENQRIQARINRKWDEVNTVNRMMDDERSKIFTMLLENVSSASLMEMKAHEELWNAADIADDIPGRKNPFMLLNLIAKTHLGMSDGVAHDIFLLRGKLANDFALFGKRANEPLVNFIERLKNFKKSIDAQAEVPILRDRNDPDAGTHRVPIIEGDELMFAEKVMTQYQDDYPEAALEYRNELLSKKREVPFESIDDAYNYLASYLTKGRLFNLKKTNMVRGTKRGRSSDEDNDSDGDVETVPDTTRDSGPKHRPDKRRSAKSGRAKLGQCRRCIKVYKDTFSFKPPQELFRHFYPNDCPIARDQGRDKDAKDKVETESKDNGDSEPVPVEDKSKNSSKKKGASANPFKKKFESRKRSKG